MKKEEIDWSILRNALIVFCVCLSVGIGLIVSAYYYNDSSKKEFKNNKNQFQSISRRYLDVDKEETLLLDYYPEFVKLYNAGYIGKEKRLNWIEALRASGEEVKVPSLSYNISTQEEFIPSFNVDYSGYKLFKSQMDLKMGLLHEGDLFNLFAELQTNADGNFTVNECSFSKKGKEIVFEREKTNISVSCLLNWITINLPEGKGIEI